MTNFDILRSGFCTTESGFDRCIKIRFKTLSDLHAGFDALMALMNAEINRLNKPEGLAGQLLMRFMTSGCDHAS